MTPDSILLESWREYQTALAIALSYLPPEREVYEWELLGRSGNEIYVWAICGEIGGVASLEGLTVLSVQEDGSVQSQPFDRVEFPDEIREKFPPEVQERYFGGLIHSRSWWSACAGDKSIRRTHRGLSSPRLQHPKLLAARQKQGCSHEN
jgi:hypothetical protein